MTIQHTTLFPETNCKLFLLPIGYYKNSGLEKAEKGDTVFTQDEVEFTFVKCSRVHYPSPILDCLCLGLYGFNQNVIFELNMKNWIGEMSEKELLLLVLKEKKK